MHSKYRDISDVILNIENELRCFPCVCAVFHTENGLIDIRFRKHSSIRLILRAKLAGIWTYGYSLYPFLIKEDSESPDHSFFQPTLLNFR